MASSVVIVYSGPPEQRHTLKVTAMQPLSAVLPAVCTKFRPALDPGSITLALNKKAVDLGVPFRLANIPSGSILNITSSRPAAAVAPATGGTAAPPCSAQAAPAVEPLPAPAARAPPGSVVAGSTLQRVLLPPAPMEQDAAPCEHLQTEQQGQQQQAPAAAGASTVPLVDLLHLSRAAGLSMPREALLTTEAALKHQQLLRLHQAGGSVSGGGGSNGGALQEEQAGGDDDDSFYELTPEDLAVIVKAAEARRKEEAQGLKTQAMRDAEEKARIQAFGPVALRLRFRDGVVVQAQFAATDTIHAVQEFMRQLLAAPPPSQGVTLFTAPPKQVLKDNTQPLFKAGLVPAALVHVQLPSTGSTLDALKPQVAACLTTALAQEQPLPGLPQHQGGAAGTAEQGAGASSSASVPAASATAEAVAAVAAARAAARSAQPQAHQAAGEGGPKAPKWFKR